VIHVYVVVIHIVFQEIAMSCDHNVIGVALILYEYHFFKNDIHKLVITASHVHDAEIEVST
jgi:hypothetical protein